MGDGGNGKGGNRSRGRPVIMSIESGCPHNWSPIYCNHVESRTGCRGSNAGPV